jgi:iron-sulfur cluster repair protein YtfE (RIC family)
MNSLAITPDLTVATVAERFPATQAVFAREGIDLCCGGAKSLEFVARAHGLDLEKLLRELTASGE